MIHERFIETPPMDMNEVRSIEEGIDSFETPYVEENMQRIEKSAVIAWSQNNASSKPQTHHEVKGNSEEKQQKSTRRFNQKKGQWSTREVTINAIF